MSTLDTAVDSISRRLMTAQREELRLMLLRVDRDPEVAELIQREIQRKERRT